MKGFVGWLLETPRFMQGMMTGAVVGMLAIGVLQVVPTAGALSLQAKRDCDNNAVVRCGALTTAEVQERYSQAGVAAIYDYFGIKAAHINSIDTAAVAGQVTKDGKVLVKGKTVATGAMTAGRQNIAGSAKITHKDTTFYARPPRVSFASSTPLAAFVVMKNGQFSYAILASCGNPVIATPIKPAKPSVTPPVTPPTPEQPTPPPAQPVAAPTETKLPATGPGTTIAVAAVATLAGAAGYHLYQRRRANQRLARAYAPISRR